MSPALQALDALLAAEPSGKRIAYEICLSSMQATKDLAGDLEAVTVKQASAVSAELQEQWRQPSNKLVMCSLQVAGYVLAEKSFTKNVSGEEQSHLLKSLTALLHSNSRKDEARVVFWCLSRQELHPDMLQQHCQAVASAIALGLITSNKWESMQCVHHSLKCIARLSQQVPEVLRQAAHLWVPQLWRLLLVQPVTQYEQPGGRPCEGALSAALVFDLVGSKRAGQPADSDGLLKVMWDWTRAAWGSDAPTGAGASGGQIAKGQVSESIILQAVTAINAWGCFVELLGGEFLRRDPPVGPPMLKLLEKLFTHTSSTRLPVATFAAWQKLCDAFATCGQLSKRQPLLLNPITFALKSDRRPAVHQAAMATWKHMVAQASKASTTEFTSSGAATSSLLASLLGPVLQVLIKMPPETARAPPARPEPCQSLWSEAVKWLSDILQGSQLLVTLLGVLSTNINSICQQQPPPPAHVIVCLTGNVLPMTAVLQQTVAVLIRDSGQSLSFLTKGWQAVKCLYVQLCSLASTNKSTSNSPHSKSGAAGLCGLAACLLQICLTTVQSHDSGEHGEDVKQCWSSCAESAMDSCTQLVKQSPACAKAIVTMPGDSTRRSMASMKVLLFAQLSMVFITVPSLRTKSSETCLEDLLLLAEQDEQAVKQLQSYWQHCSLVTDSDTCSQDRLPANLDIWSLLAASLAKSLPTSDQFDDYDAAVMAAVAFTIQVLKYPLEALRKGMSATEQDAIVVSAEDLIRAMAWGDAWQALYQALTEVTSRKRAYKLNSTDLLHAYLLRLAADMHQTADVPSAAPVEGNRHAGLSLWKCLLAAATVAVAHQAVEHGDKQVVIASRPAARASGGAKGSKPVSDVACACQLLGLCLEELCQAGTASPDTVAPLICKVLEVIPDVSLSSHGLLDLQQQLPLKAVGACLLLPSEVTGGHEKFLPILEAAWASLLSAVSVQSFSGLSQSCIAEVLLRPLAAALRHKSTAVHDAAEEFWSSSGIQSALKGYDVGLVEAALALLGSQRSQAGNVEIGLQQQVRAEQPFGRSRVDALSRPIQQGPFASSAPPAAVATAHVAVTQAQKGSPAAPGADGPLNPGMLSSKKRSRQAKTPFDESQTEYVKIPSAVKRPCVDAMTDRQKEVLARQKAGAAREGVLTYTTLDASQHTQHGNAVPVSSPNNKEPTRFATHKPGLAGKTAVHAGHAEPVMHAEPASASQPADLSVPDKKAQAGLKPNQDPQQRLLTPQAKPPAPPVAHSKPGARTMHPRPASPVNLAVKAAPSSSFQQAFCREEADMPLAAFPSTQQSTSQQACKLIGKTAAAPVNQAAPGSDASAVASGQQAEQRLHSRQRPQELHERQAQQCHQQQGQKSLRQLRPEQDQRPGHLRPPSLSPSGSSTVRPPQALRRRSGVHKAGSLDVDRLADKDPRDEAGKPAMVTAAPQAEAVSGGPGRNVSDQGPGSRPTAAAARGKGAQGGNAIPVTTQTRVSGSKKVSDGEWITRRSASPGQVQLDAPALQNALSKQAAVCEQTRQRDTKATKPDTQEGSLHSQSPGADRAEPAANQVRSSNQQLPHGKASSQQQAADEAIAALAAEKAPTGQTPVKPGAESHNQHLNTAIGKSAQKLTLGSKGISQQSPDRARGKSQKEGDGSVEGQTCGSGYKAGTWTGRLKSLFTLSGRESPTKSPLQQATEAAAKKQADADKPQAAAPMAAAAAAADKPQAAAAAADKPQAAAAAATSGALLFESEATPPAQDGPEGSKGHENSPDEAAVDKAFAMAGCLARDLVPDSADQSEQPGVKGHEQTNEEVDSHMAADKGQKQEAAPPSHQAPSAEEQGINQLTLHTLAPTASGIDPVQAQAVSMLTASGTPVVMATAAASAKPRLLDFHDDSSASQQQKTVLAVADSPKEEAGKAQAEQALSGQSQGVEQADIAAVSHHSLPGHRPQNSAGEAEEQLAGVTKGAAAAEATQAADQLPLSYPATMVATLPCTMPAWLGHSQRTAASTIIPTQVVAIQAYPAGLGPAAQAATAKLFDQPPVADAALSGRMSIITTTMAQQSAAPAGRENLQCRAISRLSQPGDAVCKSLMSMPGEAMDKSQHAVGASPGAWQGHAGLPNQALEGTAAAADVALPPRSPDGPKQARVAAKWPSSVPLERGKRPAEGSPAVSDADKAAHKRARSDSPVGVRGKEQGVDRHSVERCRPSDADVQELDIFATQQATSSSQLDRRPLHFCQNTVIHQTSSHPQPNNQPKSPSQYVELQQHVKSGSALLQHPHQQDFQYSVPSEDQGIQHATHNQQQSFVHTDRLPLHQQPKQLHGAGVRLVDQHNSQRHAARLATTSLGLDEQLQSGLCSHDHSRRISNQSAPPVGQDAAAASDDGKKQQLNELQLANLSTVRPKAGLAQNALRLRTHGDLIQLLEGGLEGSGLWAGATVDQLVHAQELMLRLSAECNAELQARLRAHKL
ncbi:hypothetical protein WJX77_006418 [Trebouxia sp. C0004]